MVAAPLLEQILVRLLKLALVTDVVLVLPRVLALVRGQELLAGLAPGAQPLAGLLAEPRGGAAGGRVPAGSGQHGVTAAAPAGLKADPGLVCRACVGGASELLAISTPAAAVSDTAMAAAAHQRLALDERRRARRILGMEPPKGIENSGAGSCAQPVAAGRRPLFRPGIRLVAD